jgi:hypothetical protein
MIDARKSNITENDLKTSNTTEANANIYANNYINNQVNNI